MGKTALCLNIAQHVALHSNLPVGMFSLEMSKEQLLMRMLCAEARVDAHKVRTGYIGKDEFRKLIDALGRTTSEIPFCAVWPLASVTMTVSLVTEGVVGLPAMTPEVLSKLSPGGSAPDARVQV